VIGQSRKGRGPTVRVATGEDLAAAVSRAPAWTHILMEPGRLYEVNAPIRVSKIGLVIDGQGASVRSGSHPTRETAELDHLFLLTGIDQVVKNIHFRPGVNGPKSTDPLAVNVRLDGVRGTVRNCRFRTGSTMAVGVIQPAATNNRILENYVDGSAITYSWGGSGGTVVAGNLIENSPGNALSGVGNGDSPNEDCWVTDNIVTNAGRMGIEDWNNTQRTVIRGNSVRTAANIGISAVGQSCIVEGNDVIDSAYAGIETGCNGSVIRGNKIRWCAAAEDNGHGIIVDGHASEFQSGATVSQNLLHNCTNGVTVWNTLTVVTISGNVISDPIYHGLHMESTADAVTCNTNMVRFNKPGESSSGFRTGILAGARALSVSGNTVTYSSTSGGSAADIAIKPTANGVLLLGNTVIGGGRTDANKPTITSFGGTPVGVVIANNAFLAGATLVTDFFVRPELENNVTT
jgi:hypothetical protein